MRETWIAEGRPALRACRHAPRAALIATLLLVACTSDPSPTPLPDDDGRDRGDECTETSADDSCETESPPAKVPKKDASAPEKDAGAAKDASGATDAASEEVEQAEPEVVAEDPGPPGGLVTAEPADEAARIFDQSVLHTFDVEIAPADLMKVDGMPSAEEYVPARLTFEGKTYEVGYRYKGSLGAFFPPCTNFLSGAKEGKCSIKLSFNWKDPEGLFFGLKKLLFHSMNNDPSMLRERLGYALFREMGVPTARASHAVLRVNGKPQIYALVEEIDGRFTRSRFTEGGKGNLYKEIWPVHDNPEAYIAALETNEDDGPSADRIQRFARAVVAGPEAMAPWLDVDVTTSYMAVDRVILNDDGAFHFYCAGQAIGNNPKAPGNHNFYWYEANKVDRLWVIPWDLDYSMAEADNPAHLPFDWAQKPAADQCTAGCSGLGSLGASGVHPGCDPLIKNLQTLSAEYQAKVDRFLSGPFRKDAVDKKLSDWKQQLTQAGYPPQEADITKLIGILDRARMNRGFKY